MVPSRFKGTNLAVASLQEPEYVMSPPSPDLMVFRGTRGVGNGTRIGTSQLCTLPAVLPPDAQMSLKMDLWMALL